MISKITVTLNIKECRLLCGGIWCTVQLEYEYVQGDERNGNTIRIYKLKPIQMPHINIEELKAGHKAFTKEEWRDVLLCFLDMESDELEERASGTISTTTKDYIVNYQDLQGIGMTSRLALPTLAQ